MTSAPARRGFKQMLAEANAVIETIDVQHALRLVGDDSVRFVDVREANEVAQTGMLPGAFHASRGFLEFFADPESPMHKQELAGRKLVLYCATGGRSTLAAKTLQEMGLDVCNMAGGIAAWTAAGGPVRK
ncbi:MAG: rhodanese-like domain-containing protein [Rhodoblastus sp.]